MPHPVIAALADVPQGLVLPGHIPVLLVFYVGDSGWRQGSAFVALTLFFLSVVSERASLQFLERVSKLFPDVRFSHGRLEDRFEDVQLPNRGMIALRL